MRRPGPLQELPLEHFLPLNPNLLHTPSTRPNKRPHSPSGPNLFSPAKRRILNEEGIYLSHGSIKSSLSPTRGRSLPLRGADCPARKLDLVSSKSAREGRDVTHTAAATPRNSISTTLAPSPQITPRFTANRVSAPSQDEQELNGYFSLEPRPSSSNTFHAPILIPREPIPCDVQSIHYPGFAVYQDTHIFIPHMATGTPEPSELIDNGDGICKENMPPRKKTRKTATTFATFCSKTVLLPSSSSTEVSKFGKADSISSLSTITDATNLLTPTSGKPMRSSPAMTPEMKKKMRVASRKILKAEADVVDGELGEMETL